MSTQAEKAAQFLKLHHGAGLLLPNAWDIASARLFEEAGFPAIATTSAGTGFKEQAQAVGSGMSPDRDTHQPGRATLPTATRWSGGAP